MTNESTTPEFPPVEVHTAAAMLSLPVGTLLYLLGCAGVFKHGTADKLSAEEAETLRQWLRELDEDDPRYDDAVRLTRFADGTRRAGAPRPNAAVREVDERGITTKRVSHWNPLVDIQAWQNIQRDYVERKAIAAKARREKREKRERDARRNRVAGPPEEAASSASVERMEMQP